MKKIDEYEVDTASLALGSRPGVRSANFLKLILRFIFSRLMKERCVCAGVIAAIMGGVR